MKKYATILIILTTLFSTLLTTKNSSAQDWVWNIKNQDFYFAATVNAAGHALGQYCYFDIESCMYLIDIGITCNAGNEYPVLINSDAGSARATLICAHKYKNRNVLAINSFDDIDRVVREASRIGFAVPMANDDFKVSRFSLLGATQAIDLMRSAAEKKMLKRPQNRNRPAEERL